MNALRSTNHGAPPRWTVVLSDELAPIFSAALSQRGLHTLALSNVAPDNGTVGVADRR